MEKNNFKLNTVYFYICGGCNLTCRHCWIKPESAVNDLDLEGVKEVVDQIKETGANSVKISGGEPFLRKDIFQALEYMRQKELKIIIETNGTLIKDAEANQLKKLGVSFISVSIDSPDALFHDEFRGLNGAWDSTVRGAKALIKAGFSLQIIASIYRKNVADIERLALFAEGLGASSLKLNPITCTGRAEELIKNEEFLGIKELINLENYIQSDLQPRIKPRILLDIPFAFKKISVIRNNRCACGLLGMIGVLSDGTISLCGIGTTIDELNMGNIKSNKLKDVWENNPIVNFIRENIPSKLEGVCGRCIFKKLCLGKCRAAAYHDSRSLTAPFFMCQEAYEDGLFPQTRLYQGG
ncbi:radical SAM protein [bacterium]|nr:MAG: radical SAM protein [bacterium]